MDESLETLTSIGFKAKSGGARSKPRGRGIGGGGDRAGSVPLSVGIAGYVAKSGDTVLLADAREHKNFYTNVDSVGGGASLGGVAPSSAIICTSVRPPSSGGGAGQAAVARADGRGRQHDSESEEAEEEEEEEAAAEASLASDEGPPGGSGSPGELLVISVKRRVRTRADASHTTHPSGTFCEEEKGAFQLACHMLSATAGVRVKHHEGFGADEQLREARNANRVLTSHLSSHKKELEFTYAVIGAVPEGMEDGFPHRAAEHINDKLGLTNAIDTNKRTTS